MTGVGGTELESARVTRLLREDIMIGRRPPGARLIERDIAAELNVSRLPVREAIRALVGEGIVIARPRSWAVVREFSRRDIQDFAEVREALETLIFEFAATRHDDDGIVRMHEALERERAAVAQGDVLAARAAAGAFHEVAATMADNDMLRELVGVFTTRMRWLFGQYEELDEMLTDHEALYEALAARDVLRVREVLPRHLARGRTDAERRLHETSRAAD